jgi:hypothetical protein
MRKAKLIAMCLAVAGIIGLGRAARAETVTAKLTGIDPMSGGDLYLNGVNIGGDYVGELEWDGTGEGNNAPFNGPFNTFCIDLNENIYFNGTYTFNYDLDVADAPKSTAYPSPLSGPMGTTRANELSELFGQHFAGLSTGDDLQAFQLAIWAIVYDTTTQVNTVTSGIFYVASGVDSTAISEADAWLADAANPANLATYHDNQLVALVGSTAGNGPYPQDQIVIDSTIPISSNGVPLPSSAVGGAILIAGLGLARWGRKALKAQTI